MKESIDDRQSDNEAHNTLTDDQKIKIIQENGGTKEDLLAILLELQQASPLGYLDLDTTNLVAKELGMNETRVYEIASYYAMLHVTPQATYEIQVCNSSPCHFSKSDEVLDMLETELGIRVGETTPDGLFKIHYTPCVGACEIGPVIKIGNDVYGNLSQEKVANMVQALRAETPFQEEVL